MRIPSRIRQSVAWLTGFSPAAASPALCGANRFGREPAHKGRSWKLARIGAAAALAAFALISLEGCQTGSQLSKANELEWQRKFSGTLQGGASTNQPDGTSAESLVLREGDTVRVSFPGSPSLNTVQQIRRDGKVSLAMVGEVVAAGLTPSQLEKELVKLYAPQLVDKEVTVALESSAFQVYVTGAVTRPGKLISDRPLSALEAVIDAGVDYQKANLKTVTVIRHENGQEKVLVLNLKKALEGAGGEPFYLKPSDVIFVRERFTWF